MHGDFFESPLLLPAAPEFRFRMVLETTNCGAKPTAPCFGDAR